MTKFEWNKCIFEVVDIGGGTMTNDIDRHSHSKNSFEFHFITGGSGDLITENRTYNIQKNDFFITGPGLVHAQTTNIENPVTDVCIYIQKKDDKKANGFAKLFLDNNFCYIKNFDMSAAKKIFYENKKKMPDYRSVIAANISIILTQVTRSYLPEHINENDNENNLYDRRFLIIEEYFLYRKHYSLPELSKRLGVCERQTQRLLQKYYNQSFREKAKFSSKTNELSHNPFNIM